jgi:hypothetical protein
MGETLKTGGEKSSASTALPGRRLATSKSPRMLEPFEIDLLRQDLRAALARLERPGADSAWRRRVMTIADPFGVAGRLRSEISEMASVHEAPHLRSKSERERSRSERAFSGRRHVAIALVGRAPCDRQVMARRRQDLHEQPTPRVRRECE